MDGEETTTKRGRGRGRGTRGNNEIVYSTNPK